MLAKPAPQSKPFFPIVAGGIKKTGNTRHVWHGEGQSQRAQRTQRGARAWPAQDGQRGRSRSAQRGTRRHTKHDGEGRDNHNGHKGHKGGAGGARAGRRRGNRRLRGLKRIGGRLPPTGLPEGKTAGGEGGRERSAGEARRATGGARKPPAQPCVFAVPPRRIGRRAEENRPPSRDCVGGADGGGVGLGLPLMGGEPLPKRLLRRATTVAFSWASSSFGAASRAAESWLPAMRISRPHAPSFRRSAMNW